MYHFKCDWRTRRGTVDLNGENDHQLIKTGESGLAEETIREENLDYVKQLEKNIEDLNRQLEESKNHVAALQLENEESKV